MPKILSNGEAKKCLKMGAIKHRSSNRGFNIFCALCPGRQTDNSLQNSRRFFSEPVHDRSKTEIPKGIHKVPQSWWQNSKVFFSIYEQIYKSKQPPIHLFETLRISFGLLLAIPGWQFSFSTKKYSCYQIYNWRIFNLISNFGIGTTAHQQKIW